MSSVSLHSCHALIAGDDTQQGQRESVKAQALMEKAERLLETAGAEDREDLVDGIEAVRDALDPRLRQ